MRTRIRLVVVTVVVTVLAIIAIVVIAGLIVIYTGAPDVSAVHPHGAVVAWILSTTADRAVEAASQKVHLPPDYDQINLHDGYRAYNDMCVGCHGAPGVDRLWVGEGLYPKPPHLYESVRDLEPQAVFWIARNGIKDTGMPALAATGPDKDIWTITAFVKHMPELTPEQYKAFGQGSTPLPPNPTQSLAEPPNKP